MENQANKQGSQTRPVEIEPLTPNVQGATGKTLFFPFGDELNFRHQEEKVQEEVYRTIPALNQLALSTLIVTNKISQESRNALLLQDGKIDPELRVLKVEVGMTKRHQMENAQPDMQYLAGVQAAKRADYESPTNDVWLGNQP